ncbi:transposase [Streptomyces sp. C]|uniref:transposase n=1 Tax=Streptomyces sp. C TaxID=253839 RepID=UPI001F5050A5|nr:transposase [Streptomyces sp. C]
MGSTQLCSHCGALDGPKGREGLSVRSWRCACGARHDRDENAELNLRLEGRSLVAAGRSRPGPGSPSSAGSPGSRAPPSTGSAPRRPRRAPSGTPSPPCSCAGCGRR